MPQRTKPRSLRPMSKEQKYWFVGTIILFVLFMSVGWYFTVARVLQQTLKGSGTHISTQLSETKKAFVGEQDVGKKVQDTIQNVKSLFTKEIKSPEEQNVEQTVLDNLKEEIKKTSTP
jgi:hypothetical protein